MWLEIMKSKRHNLGIYFDCDFNNNKKKKLMTQVTQLLSHLVMC